MGSADVAHQLLQYWISRHNSEFQADATNSFEATVAHSLQNVSTGLGVCSCTILITPRLQNNYGTLNGGCMAALACIVAGTALETVSARSGIVASSSMDYLSAMPGNAVVEVVAKVSAVTDSVAAVDVVLQDATTKRLVARARYIEQAPHGIRAKAASYLHSAATAAKSAVQRLQQNAGSIRHKAGDILFEDSNGQHAEHAEPILGTAREAASAYMASATATMKAAAQRLQHAAENALQSSSADVTLHNSNTLETASEVATAAESASQSASSSASTLVSSAKGLVSSTAAAADTRSQSAAGSAPQFPSQSAAESSAEAAAAHMSAADQQTNPQSSSGQTEDNKAVQSNSVLQSAKQSLLQRASMVTESFRDDDCSSFDTCLGRLLKDIQVGSGTCTAVLPTTARLADAQGMVHVGCYCSLVDLISTTALAAADKRPAVSVTISVDFFAALPVGEALQIESRVVKTGKSLTFAEVNFRQTTTGDLIAQGTHVEFSAGGEAYPSTIQEYHRQQLSRQQSSKL